MTNKEKQELVGILQDALRRAESGEYIGAVLAFIHEDESQYDNFSYWRINNAVSVQRMAILLRSLVLCLAKEVVGQVTEKSEDGPHNPNSRPITRN